MEHAIDIMVLYGTFLGIKKLNGVAIFVYIVPGNNNQHIPNIVSLSSQFSNPYSGRIFITKGIPSSHLVRYVLTFSHYSSHQLPFFLIVNYVTDGKQKCIQSTKGTNF